MTSRTYASAEAFKTALDQRMRRNLSSREELPYLRQRLVFERFMARVGRALGDAATLKGGLVLELRLARARATVDIDLGIHGRPEAASARLQEAGRLDLGDFMRFDVRIHPRHPDIQNPGMKYDGLRFRGECHLAGKIFGEPFGIDLAFGDPIFGDVDLITGSDTLAFAGIAPVTVRVYPVVTHVAEKLHAYTMPRPRQNSRVKDLPDMALLATANALQGQYLLSVVKQVFAYRGTHEPPVSFPPPPESWEGPYARIAKVNGLRWTTLGEVTAAVRAFLDPVLGGKGGRWDPVRWRWTEEIGGDVGPR